MTDLFVLYLFAPVCFLAASICFCLYELFKLRKILTRLKIKLNKNQVSMKNLHEQMTAIEKKLEEQAQNLSTIGKTEIFSPAVVQDKIEHQYERARRIVTNNSTLDQALLKSCSMTPEEIELLTDVVMAQGEVTTA